VDPSNSERLINDTWTSDDLSAAFDENASVPEVASINAHFDHYRALPGAGNTTGDETDLYTTENISRLDTEPRVLPGGLIFSMGCHSGLNISDLLAPSPSPDQAVRLLDWPEAFSDQGAAVYVANTGYGYGDTEAIAYSEQLMALFSAGLAPGASVGEALASAKREYFLNLVHLQTYDEKVLAQTTFYGLPMFKIAGTATPDTSNPGALPFITDPISGSTGVTLELDPQFEEVDLGAKGSYFTVNDQSQATSGRPIQPIVGVDLPAGPNGATARGIIITDLQSSDVPNTNAVFSKPGSDTGQPEQPSGGTFPASIHSISTALALPGPNSGRCSCRGSLSPIRARRPALERSVCTRTCRRL
jgi:hypothetical protein